MAFPLIKAGSGTEDFQPIGPAAPSSLITEEKPRVFLTSVKIPDDHIWANGLFQNVYVIYKLFEVMGWEPWIMVDNNDNNKDAKHNAKFRTTDFRQFMVAPFPVKSYIEVGMSCDPSIRHYFRMTGAKVSKLYLGNILNIDIETTTFTPGVNFSHHVAGEIDEIWVSPHYDIHAEYAGAINGLCGKTRIAPYVWDPLFIQELGQAYVSTGISEDTPRTFVIMEPNISFQKSAFIPILALEVYARRYPSRVKEIIVINGQKLATNPYYQNNVLPYLTVHTKNKLKLMPRAHMINAARVFKDAIVLQHQVNNEYNYSTLEWLTMGFPLIHNVSRFKDYGYYYEGNDFMRAADRIADVVMHHDKNMESYIAHAKQLGWRFSIYNPENISAWRELATVRAPGSEPIKIAGPPSLPSTIGSGGGTSMSMVPPSPTDSPSVMVSPPSRT